MFKSNWRIGLVVLIGVLFLVAARPQATQESYYATDSYHDAFTADARKVNMAELSYPFVQEGTFYRQGDSWVSDMPRWVTISGACAVKRDPAHVSAWVYTDNGVYPLFDTHELTMPFSLPVYAQTLRVVLTEQEGFYDTVTIRCNVNLETP